MKTKKGFLAISIALALSGCGGGSSSSSSSGSSSFLEAIPVEAADDFGNLGSSVPAQGSVTQSTNINSGNATTEDSFNVVVSGDPNSPVYMLSYDANDDSTPEDTIDSSDFSNARTSSFYVGPDNEPFNNTIIGLSDGAEFDVDGDGSANGNVYVYLYTDYGVENDTDYIAGGFWLYVPDNYSAADPYAMGAFVDGNDEVPASSLASQTGTATYDGNMAGVYSVISDSADVQNIYSDVEINVNFGTDKISGSLTNFFAGTTQPSFLGGSITLAETDIGSDDGGFFTGALTGQIEDVDVSGNYGGLFYGSDGNRPTRVAGTIGGSGADSDGVHYDFVGAFGTFVDDGPDS